MARSTGPIGVRARFANPWWVVVGAVLSLCVCNGPVLFFTFGVFLKPIVADMQWQRSRAAAVPLGRTMDRWGIRRLALPALIVSAVCMCMLAPTPDFGPAVMPTPTG